MKLSNYQLIAGIGALLLLQACATNKAQYKYEDLQSQMPDKEISHSFYLIGDAGYSELGSKTMALQSFEKKLESANENSTALFLGDNVYQRGIPEENHPNYPFAKHQLDAQTSVVKDFAGRTIFIPGNHDWYSGLEGLKRQERYIEEKLGKDSFLPENGCPLERIEINEELVLLIVDPEWYITKWDIHPNINDNCEIRTRQRFLEEFESEVKKARGKTTVVAIHHPMYTNGPHGGQYSFGSHMVPLPVLGTLKNVLLRTGGFSPADLTHKRYDELKRSLVTLAQENDKVIFVSGHEHSLQYLVQDNLVQIISGSGSKTTPTRNVFGGQFSYGTPGYARLDVYEDGSSYVRFYSASEEKVVFETDVLKDDEVVIPNLEKDFPATKTASIFTKEETEYSNFYKWLWGERYRDLYSTPVKVPTVDLDTLYGGLKPIRKGGGTQSVSLRMENPEGQEYVLRALRKNAAQFIQAEAFQERFVRRELEETGTESLVMDVFTGSHPYVPFILADLSDAVGIFHTNPKLYYVPRQNALGKYFKEFGDALYMIEERTTDGHGDKASFGYSNEMISTFDMIDKLHKDEENRVDEVAYVRARLFDMLIGDWDRHDDQWRWAEFKEDGYNIYRPVPRDRDQPFSIMDDGFLIGLGTSLIQGIRILNSYDEDIKDIKYASLSAFPLDVALMQRADKAIWDEQATYITSRITDEVIDRAFNGLPDEVKDESVDEIKLKLKGRRANLKKISDSYYEVVNKYAMIKGTDKDDWFDIERMPFGKTKVTGYRIKDGKKADIIHERVYDREHTKEIWLYAMDDDDYIQVSGEGDHLIKLRLIGGSNNDTYDIQNGQKAHIYDFKNKPNEFVTNKGRKHIRNEYEDNNYYYEKPKHNNNSILPVIGFNPDDGLLLGLSDTYTTNGFERNPFTSRHQISGAYFFATSGFAFRYNGEFANVVGELNLDVRGTWTSPSFSINFFGFGNSTPNPQVEDEENFDLDYNRVKLGTLKGYLGLVWRGDNNGKILFGARYETVDLQITEGRFIEAYDMAVPQLTKNNFFTAEATYHFRNLDVPSFPTLGLEASLRTGFTSNVDNSNSFGFLIPKITFHHKVIPSGRLVFNTTSKAHINFSDELEFYQAASIGGSDGLRGYRNQRFTGKNSFYQSSNLLFNFGSRKTNILPVDVGILGGFDVGRVWVDNSFVLDPSFNGESWNTSAGGGFFMNVADLFALNLGLFNSDDSLRFYVGVNVGF
ncbi:MAG: metallophosphoesterase [Flavobacteriaceae bacterium]